METFNKSIEMGSVSMESRHPYRMDKSNIFIVNYIYIYIESGSTKPEILCRTLLWSEESSPGKGRRMGPIMGHAMHYRRTIITLPPGYSIPPLLEILEKRT